MTRILLVRHGHVEGISPARFRGHADLALTSEGRRQAEATAQRIQATWRPAAIYSSRLSRCLATGATIGKPFDLTPIVLAGLIDIDYGEWQGLSLDEVKTRWPEELGEWFRNPDRAAIPGGESLPDVRRRSAMVLETVARQHPDDTVVLVAHDSVNRVILLHTLDAPLSRYWRIKQDPCAINEIDIGENGGTIVTVNQTDHLRNL